MDDTEKTTEKQPEPAPVADSPRAPAIHAAIAACMAEIGGVAKLGVNKEQRYPFRAIADVYRACQGVMARHGVHTAPVAVEDYSCREVTSKGGAQGFHVTMKVTHRFWASDGSSIDSVTIGEATDWSDKSSNKAMSAASKYSLVQSFCLPDEDPEAEGDNEHPEIAAAPKPPEKPQPTTAQVEALSTLLQRLAPWKPEATEVERPAAMRAWCDRALAQKEGTLKSVRELSPEQTDECIKIAKVTLDARGKELIK